MCDTLFLLKGPSKSTPTSGEFVGTNAVISLNGGYTCYLKWFISISYNFQISRSCSIFWHIYNPVSDGMGVQSKPHLPIACTELPQKCFCSSVSVVGNTDSFSRWFGPQETSGQPGVRVKAVLWDFEFVPVNLALTVTVVRLNSSVSKVYWLPLCTKYFICSQFHYRVSLLTKAHRGPFVLTLIKHF